ncbi:MAG TPA: RAD55 family ATPase, partial [Thermoplasmata archaeon]|nr:RAD55 family ATPase [Thermoplasmata archaeon]
MAVEFPAAPMSPWVPSGRARPALSAITDLRIPSGIADFDQVSGGFPSGSVVLLLGETGAGHQEFALTSATHLMFHYDEQQLHRFYLAVDRENYRFPRAVAYVSLTRSREQVLQELSASFDNLYRNVFERHLTFLDLSGAYFADTIVPSAWSAPSGGLLASVSASRSSTDSVLSALASSVEQGGPDNVLIVDSLTDLLARPGVAVPELLALIKGLRRRAKSWNGVVYLLLSHGVAGADTEQALADSVDAVLSFSWNQSPTRSSRQRTLLVAKSMPVLSHVPHEHQ